MPFPSSLKSRCRFALIFLVHMFRILTHADLFHQRNRRNVDFFNKKARWKDPLYTLRNYIIKTIKRQRCALYTCPTNTTHHNKHNDRYTYDSGNLWRAGRVTGGILSFARLNIPPFEAGGESGGRGGMKGRFGNKFIGYALNSTRPNRQLLVVLIWLLPGFCGGICGV